MGQGDAAYNAGPDITFGCGAFLPGQGPYNFGDFDPGNLVYGGEGGFHGGSVGPLDPIGDPTERPPYPGEPQEGSPNIGPGPGGFGTISWPQSGWTIGCPDAAACGGVQGDGCSENNPDDKSCCDYPGCPDLGFFGCDCVEGNTDCCPPVGGSDPEFNWGGQSPAFNGDIINLEASILIGEDTGGLPATVILDPDVWVLNDLNTGNIIFSPESWGDPGGLYAGDCSNWYTHYDGNIGFSQDLIRTFESNGRIILSHFHTGTDPGSPNNYIGDPCNFGIVCCLPTYIQFRIDWSNPRNGNTGFFFVRVALTFDEAGTAPLTAGGPGAPARQGFSIRKRVSRYAKNLVSLVRDEGVNWEKRIANDARSKNFIDLNSPKLEKIILDQKPTGLMDNEIAYITRPANNPPKMVLNSTDNELFQPMIDENIEYLLTNIESLGDWDSTKSAGITTEALLTSLKPEVISLLREVKNYDGTPLSNVQIFDLIGTRLLEGKLGGITIRHLKSLASSTIVENEGNFEIIKSNNSLVNESAALALVENGYFSLDPNKSEGKMRWILPNWKVFATDVDKHIEIRLANGTLQKFYVKDDNTLVDRSNIMVQDGDFVEVKVGGVLKKFFCKSEIDHAFIMPEKLRLRAINLLGGNSNTILSVSADASTEIEFNYSLSAPRQNFYVLSAVLSSTVTEPSPVGSYLLKDTKLTYELMDTSSATGLDAVNEYIRYKANYKVYMLDDDDRMLDYIETTKKLQVQQTDILVDAPKTTKSTPLLVRQIPWYIVVYPTNRPEYNVFNAKSKLLTYDPSGACTRSLNCSPTLAPEFNKPNLDMFVPQVITGMTYPDAIGNYNTQNRIAQITASDYVYETGYRKNNVQIGSAKSIAPKRNKTTFRLIKEIISELNKNYIIDWDSLGRTLTTFDVISRLNIKQFSSFIKLENYHLLFPLIKNGLVENVKVFEPTGLTSPRLASTKTQLIQRKSTAGPDTFLPIKTMASGYQIKAPTSAGPKYEAVERVPISPF